MKRSNATLDSASARVINPADLIGTRDAAGLLGITKASVVRRVKAGTLAPLAKLDGELGAFVFDRNDIEHVARTSSPRASGPNAAIRREREAAK